MSNRPGGVVESSDGGRVTVQPETLDTGTRVYRVQVYDRTGRVTPEGGLLLFSEEMRRMACLFNMVLGVNDVVGGDDDE